MYFWHCILLIPVLIFCIHTCCQVGRSFGLLRLYRSIPYQQLVTECMYCLSMYFFHSRGQIIFIFLVMYFVNSSGHYILHSHMLSGWSQFRFVALISEHTLSATGKRVDVLFANVFFSFPGTNMMCYPNLMCHSQVMAVQRTTSAALLKEKKKNGNGRWPPSCRFNTHTHTHTRARMHTRTHAHTHARVCTHARMIFFLFFFTVFFFNIFLL